MEHTLQDAINFFDKWFDECSDEEQWPWQILKTKLNQQINNIQSNQCHEDTEKYYKDE